MRGQGAGKGRRELGVPTAGAGAGAEGALTLLFTSTMLSGLRAGVLCGLAIAGPGGPGTVPQAARGGAGAQPGWPARAAPPLTVALAPPSHPDHDVKAAATERNAESTFPRKRRCGWRRFFLALTSLRYGSHVRKSLRGRIWPIRGEKEGNEVY